MVKEMIKNRYVIPMENPVEVSRKFKKKRNSKLPSLNRGEKFEKQEARTKREEDNIRKKGIFYIKDSGAKKVWMPKFSDFRFRTPIPPKEVIEESTEGKMRPINIASTNPLDSFDPKKKVKKGKVKASLKSPSKRIDK